MKTNESVEPGLDETKFIASMTELRLALGWSQSELARRMAELGYKYFNQMTVSRTEKLDRPLRLGEARAIARIFGVSVNRMIEAEDLGQASSDAVNRLSEMDARLAEMEAELAGHIAATGRLQLEIARLRSAREALASDLVGERVVGEAFTRLAEQGWTVDAGPLNDTEDGDVLRRSDGLYLEPGP